MLGRDISDLENSQTVAPRLRTFECHYHPSFFLLTQKVALKLKLRTSKHFQKFVLKLCSFSNDFLWKEKKHSTSYGNFFESWNVKFRLVFETSQLIFDPNYQKNCFRNCSFF